MKFAIAVTLLLSFHQIDSAAEPIENVDSTPSIRNCVYTDAHWLECTWLEPISTKENYRMAFMRASDPTDTRSFHVCTDTIPKHELPMSTATHDVKSCAFPAHMFSTYQIYLVDGWCQDGDMKCHNISELLFEASPDFVYLTSPATQLNVDNETMLLSWYGPDRAGSMLRFALVERKVNYIVSYREVHSDVWNDCYEGYQPHVSLPPLKPSTTYEIRITSVLDAPNGDFLHSRNMHDWGSPVSFLNFTTSGDIYSNLGQMKNATDDDSFTTASASDFTEHISPDSLNQQTVTTIVVGVILLLVILIAIPLMHRCKCFTCDGRNKTAKPFLRVDFKKNSITTQTQSYGTTDTDMERYAPISRLLQQPEPISNLRSDMFMTEDEMDHEFCQKSDYSKVFFEPTSRSDLERNVLNKSISVNEELSENGNDTMSDISLAYLKQVPSSPCNGIKSHSLAHSSCCGNGNEAPPSECSLPSYILGPCDMNYVYNNSVSSYVTGSEISGDKLSPKKAKNDIGPMATPDRTNFNNIILNKSNNNTNIFHPANAQVVHIVCCPVCNSKNSPEMHSSDCSFIEPPELLRRNSYSDHSVDSGYSPDNLDTTVKNY